MRDMLDPAKLTPEQLYRLQSDTWAQGAKYEQDRIIEILHVETGHNGKTHYEGMTCRICDIIVLIRGED